MILETKLNNLDNKPIKVNKKTPPMSINKDLTPFYFTAMFIGAKNSGKSYGLVKLLKFYERLESAQSSRRGSRRHRLD